jgi:putative sulfotransferase
MLRLHPDILSISEFFSLLGGPRAFESALLSRNELWTLLSRPAPELAGLLGRVDVPEILATPLSAVRAGKLAPIALVTLPHLTDAPEQLLAELRDHALLPAPSTPRAHFSHLFDWLRVRFGRQVWVERSGGSLEYAELLRDNWPQAKFVHLTRDGRDTAPSMAAHPMFKVRLARLVSGRADLSVAECLRADVPCERYASYWSALMIKAQRFARSVPRENFTTVTYEDLVRSPMVELTKLAHFMTGSAASSEWLHRAASLLAARPSRPNSMAPAQRKALEDGCRLGLRYLASLGN